MLRVLQKVSELIRRGGYVLIGQLAETACGVWKYLNVKMTAAFPQGPCLIETGVNP